MNTNMWQAILVILIWARPAIAQTLPATIPLPGGQSTSIHTMPLYSERWYETVAATEGTFTVQHPHNWSIAIFRKPPGASTQQDLQLVAHRPLLESYNSLYKVSASMRQGDTYLIRLHYDHSNGPGGFTMQWDYTADLDNPVPARAYPISGLGTVMQHIVPVDDSPQATSRYAWYRWQAPFAGLAGATAISLDRPPIELTWFEECAPGEPAGSVSPFVTIQQNTYVGGGIGYLFGHLGAFQSFPVHAGQYYLIRVELQDFAVYHGPYPDSDGDYRQGRFRLSLWQQEETYVPGDYRGDAQQIGNENLPGLTFSTLTGQAFVPYATLDPTDPPWPGEVIATRWYQWTAPENGRYYLIPASRPLRVFRQPALEPVPMGLPDALELGFFPATQGETYLIEVGETTRFTFPVVDGVVHESSLSLSPPLRFAMRHGLSPYWEWEADTFGPDGISLGNKFLFGLSPHLNSGPNGNDPARENLPHYVHGADGITRIRFRLGDLDGYPQATSVYAEQLVSQDLLDWRVQEYLSVAQPTMDIAGDEEFQEIELFEPRIFGADTTRRAFTRVEFHWQGNTRD